MISIVTPAFNENTNLPRLHERLTAALTAAGVEWEWIVVDDHSRVDTFAVVERLAAVDRRVRGIRLARNAGSHVAIACGLRHAGGDAVALLAADLQDPPEMLAQLVERWRAGAQVVWAVRRQQPGEGAHKGFAAIYYWVMRRLVGFHEMPATGADFFLIDRVVVDAFCRAEERNTSVFALITWLGFRQAYVEYDKQPRASGQSGWTLARKIKLVVDSVTAFSDFPIRWCVYLGLGLLASSVVLLVGAIIVQSVAIVLLLAAILTGLSGLNLLALGVIGQYVWRALDEARRRPLYSIEAAVGSRLPAAEPGFVANGR